MDSGILIRNRRLIGSCFVSLCRAALLFILLSSQVSQNVSASENVPHLPFAEGANVPEKGQLVVGLVYEESEAYHVWAGGQRHNITWHADGESYGIDINQGYLALQYGLTPRWAADLNVGGTTLGWRSFDNGTTHSTSGLMDWSFGVRYQVFEEGQAPAVW